jgi:hypothetical protein
MQTTRRPAVRAKEAASFGKALSYILPLTNSSEQSRSINALYQGATGLSRPRPRVSRQAEQEFGAPGRKLYGREAEAEICRSRRWA